ncbi:ribosome-associated protein [Luteibacter rhizovicinus]|uniref:Dual-action ribosomal maturation protein DarP n=1 Tax=Luteibacter rhizovicinus TaxID=242606 RepID=A0A4R3YGA1_9GAMM|nr:ribosome biogenesis factor YjgA [Luteibacter rhizovicinus]TCV91257.1 ribosome-associated protein [Luteibacter rhizovicinus]
MTNETYDEGRDLGRGRSENRRKALDILKLAGQLMELPPSRIPKLNLPDDIVDEIARTRKITAHIARKRQLAFLAKQMRKHGDEAFTDARAALGEDRQRQREDAAFMHRIEARRERLMEDGDVALGELFDQHPELDRQHMRSLIRQARIEKEKAKPPHAFRELYQILKDLEAKGQDDADGDVDVEAHDPEDKAQE